MYLWQKTQGAACFLNCEDKHIVRYTSEIYYLNFQLIMCVGDIHKQIIPERGANTGDIFDIYDGSVYGYVKAADYLTFVELTNEVVWNIFIYLTDLSRVVGMESQWTFG